MHKPARPLALGVGASVVVLALIAFAAARSLQHEPTTPTASEQPNIVYIMVDDLASDLVPYMNEVQAMAAEGVTFDNFIVTNSLCCPSRASYLTGKYPHNNFVLGNSWPRGGIGQFLEHDVMESVGVYIRDAGYRTGFFGKFLNHYEPHGFDDGPGGEPDFPPAFMPPGWDEVWIPGNGYQEFNYSVTAGSDGDAEIVTYAGDAEKNYLTDQLAAEAEDFIDRNADEPFFLNLTPFGVHFGIGADPQGRNWFPPAPRDRPATPNRPQSWAAPEFPEGGDCGGGGDGSGGCDDVAYPPTPEIFNVPIENAVTWAPTTRLAQEQLDRIEAGYLDQIRMAQSVDDLVGRVRAALADAGVENNTYVVFGSDNGFHLGEHALFEGKTTPYDHDVRVPFIVVPPGGVAPRTESEIVSNVDLLPTFADIAGVTSFPEPLDGASLRWLIDDTAGPSPWREGVLIQHVRAGSGDGGDPDEPRGVSVLVPTYHALRTATYLYTDYSALDGSPPVVGAGEYFDLSADPMQTENIYADLPASRQAELNDALVAYAACAGPTCWSTGLALP